ncbi:MAG: alpha/beta hydrolase-fold protein [Thermoplasmata archaeon]
MPRGTVLLERLDSAILKENPLGDPTSRDVAVYLPPRYDPMKRYPIVYGIVGYTGTGRSLFNIDPLAEDLASKMDRLIASGKCGPMIIAAPDCFTRVGGNQYVNSSAVGRYEDYLLKEVIPFVESKVRVGRRGIWGKSSGGYGSIIQGMRHPEIFSALADHSGDSVFELCYIQDFAAALAAFRKAGGPKAWLRRFWKQPNRHHSEDHPVLNTLGMAAFYTPNPRSPHMGIDFPFDLKTGEWRPEVWERWRAWDPVNRVARSKAALRRLRLVYIDCGTKDEFNLIWGARTLHAKLGAMGIRHVYEEFEDGHMSITYRYDTSLPLLWRALKA